MSANKRKVSESDIIKLATKVYKKTLKNSPFSKLIEVGLGDDCFAFLAPEKKQVVVTSDALFEGVHFDCSFFSYFDIGYRSISLNISDLASHGANPAFVFVSIGFTKGTEKKGFEEFFEGIEQSCLEHGCVLSGGDTNLSKTLAVSVTAIGFAERKMVRSAARPGDLICVTGKLGLAAAGYYVLKHGLKKEGFEKAVQKFLRPKARVEESRILVESGVKCCEDVSDGLLRDLNNIAESSRVGFEIHLDKVPVAEELKLLERFDGSFCASEVAVSFGDDYELLFTARREALEILKKKGLEFSVIGEVVEDRKLRRVYGLREDFQAGGYEHSF